MPGVVVLTTFSEPHLRVGILLSQSCGRPQSDFCHGACGIAIHPSDDSTDQKQPAANGTPDFTLQEARQFRTDSGPRNPCWELNSPTSYSRKSRAVSVAMFITWMTMSAV